MKKIVLFILAFLVIFTFSVKFIYADENEIEEPTTEEITEETFTEEVKGWLSQYLDSSIVASIITWAIDAGVLGALFIVYLRYRKYKHYTLEDLIGLFKNEMGVWLKENFDKLSADELEKVKATITDLQVSNETIMKVLVLMQDNSAKGRATLLEYLGSKTNSQEIKNATTEVANVIKEEQIKNDEVKEKVSGDYEAFF